jgi:hypothetical protein
MSNLTLRTSLGLVIFLCCVSLSAQRTETRSLSDFCHIKSTASVDVILTQGTACEARIETQNISSDRITTEVINGTLTIGMKRGSSWNSRAKVYLSCRELCSLNISGSGNLESNSGIYTNKLDVFLNGSGDVDCASIAAEQLSVTINGSGNVSLGGTADEVTYNIFGSGDIEARELVAADCQARISGSGDVTLHASRSIKAQISGSGDISYTGNPVEKQTRVSGSGDIRAIR